MQWSEVMSAFMAKRKICSIKIEFSFFKQEIFEEMPVEKCLNFENEIWIVRINYNLFNKLYSINNILNECGLQFVWTTHVRWQQMSLILHLR